MVVLLNDVQQAVAAGGPFAQLYDLIRQFGIDPTADRMVAYGQLLSFFVPRGSLWPRGVISPDAWRDNGDRLSEFPNPANAENNLGFAFLADNRVILPPPYHNPNMFSYQYLRLLDRGLLVRRHPWLERSDGLISVIKVKGDDVDSCERAGHAGLPSVGKRNVDPDVPRCFERSRRVG
jgi:hypothetical protein